MTELRKTDPEPACGSVVLLHGESGTAAQRFFNDGNWHTTTGAVLDWGGLFTVNRNRAPLMLHEVLGEDENI